MSIKSNFGEMKAEVSSEEVKNEEIKEELEMNEPQPGQLFTIDGKSSI